MTSDAPKSLDPRTYRDVLGHYPTGVCVITAKCPDQAHGMIVGSFTSVSLDPPLVAFFPSKASTSWPRIENTGRFCVNILGSDQLDICKKLSSPASKKFENISYRLSPGGAPIIDSVVAWIDCTIHSTIDAGDHFIVLGLVDDLKIERSDKSMIFFKGAYGEFSGAVA